MRLPRKLFPRRARAAAPATAASPAQAPRAPRVGSLPLEKLSLHIFAGDALRIAEVENVSVSGIAIRRASVAELPTGEQVHGRLMIDGEEFALDMQVARSSNAIVGCRFLTDLSRVRAALLGAFAPELLAVEMHPVAKRRLQRTGDGEARWFTGTHGSELYYTMRAGKAAALGRLELSVFGMKIRLDPGEPLRYAVDDAAAFESVGKPLTWSTEIPVEATRFARRFVAAIPGLKKNESEIVVQALGR